MKLPRIVADQGIPSQIPGGLANANEFGAGTAQVLDEGTRQATHAGLRAADQFAYASDVLEKAKAKAELDGALTAFKGQMTDADIALQDQGVDPDQFPAALRSAIKDRASAISDGITSPLAKSMFAANAGALAEIKLSAAKYDARKRKNGLTQIQERINQTEDANTAVMGTMDLEPQPDGTMMPQKQAAFKRGMERGEIGLREGRYSPDEAAAMTSKFLADVERGGIARDLRNPEYRAAVLSTLVHGGYKHMSIEAQMQLAQQEQTKSDQENKNTHEATEKWWKDKQAATVSDLFALASAKTLDPGVLEQARKDWHMSREDYAAIQNEMAKPLEEKPSDPATLDRLDIAVHSQNPTATEGLIHAERAAGRITRKDTVAYLDKLVAERDRQENKADSIDTQRFNQAKAMMLSAYNIPASADKFEGNQGKVFAAGLRELTARSKGSGGTEDAMKVVNEIIPVGRAALGDDVQLEIDKLRTLLKFKTLPELKAARASNVISEGEYQSQTSLMIDLNDAMARQNKVDEAAAKAAAEKAKKDAERAASGLRRFLPSFGAPPANAPTNPKDLGRQ